VTLKVSAVDPSPDDLVGTFTYVVDWGDGSAPISFDGPADPPVTHAYATAGGFTMTATVTDPGGTTSDPLTFAIDVVTQAVGEFCNTSPIVVPDDGGATPYPSTITVSGAEVFTQAVTVQLAGISHAFPDDVDVLLVGPTGANVVLMSDVGGGAEITGVTLTFDDGATAGLPGGSMLTTGTFRPTNVGGGDAWPAPAPAPSGASTLATFRDLDPNGVWSLFVVDDAGDDAGSIGGGWCLTITSGPEQFTATAVVSSPNPSTFGEAVTFTATVTDTDGDPVADGTVTFSEGARTLGVVDVDVAGQAALTTPGNTFTVGRRVVTAAFDGPGWAPSSGSVDQLVAPAAPAQGEFCNAAAIAVPGSGTEGPAGPYPSTITVSGAGSVTLLVTVELAGVAHTFPDDVDVLLVGPTGENVVLMSDTGGGADVSDVTLTFADGAAELPNGPTLTSGTFRPTNFGAGDVWPAPAPAASGLTTLATFDGVDPNGTWSLFVVDDADDDDGAIAGGWCINIASFSPAGIADAGGPYSIAEGDDLVLDASASLAGTAASFSWDVDGDGTFGDAAGATPTVTWDELVALGVDGDGDFTVTVQVTDGATTDTAEASLTVTETPTVASIEGPSTAGVGVPVTLKVSAVDPSPDDLVGTFTFDVDWGDGTPPISVDGPADPPVTHTYTAAGSFTVTAVVTSPDGTVSDPLTFAMTVTQQAPTTTTTPAPTTTVPAPTTTGPSPTTSPAPTTSGPAPPTTGPAPTTAGPSTTAAPAAGELPITGGDPVVAILAGIALVAVGAVTIAASRRNRGTSSPR
jgi:PKD repeat protein